MIEISLTWTADLRQSLDHLNRSSMSSTRNATFECQWVNLLLKLIRLLIKFSGKIKSDVVADADRKNLLTNCGFGQMVYYLKTI